VPFMKRASLLLLAILAIGCSRSPQPGHGKPASSNSASATTPMSEDRALTLLVASLKAHKVADIACLQFFNESDVPDNAKAPLWEFAAHENHNAQCGGDPNTSPVRDRYKVDAAGTVWVYDAAEADYKPL
jgi:hypothetical protein